MFIEVHLKGRAVLLNADWIAEVQGQVITVARGQSGVRYDVDETAEDLRLLLAPRSMTHEARGPVGAGW